MILKTVGSVILSVIDGEFFLRKLPNSGGVVVARSAWLSTVLLFAYIALTERLRPGATWAFCSTCLAAAIVNDLKLGGAIFAAAYAAFYARFSSQWLYLAGLYNQIMATQVREGRELDDVGRAKLALWKAAFIEDAQTVHLAAKPTYATVIVAMLADDEIRRAYIESTVKGEAGVTELEEELKDVIGSDAFNRLRILGAQATPPIVSPPASPAS